MECCIPSCAVCIGVPGAGWRRRLDPLHVETRETRPRGVWQGYKALLADLGADAGVALTNKLYVGALRRAVGEATKTCARFPSPVELRALIDAQPRDLPALPVLTTPLSTPRVVGTSSAFRTTPSLLTLAKTFGPRSVRSPWLIQRSLW